MLRHLNCFQSSLKIFCLFKDKKISCLMFNDISHYSKPYLDHFLLNCSFWQFKLYSSILCTSCSVKIQKSVNVFILNSMANEEWSLGSCYALSSFLLRWLFLWGRLLPVRWSSSSPCCSQGIIRFSLSHDLKLPKEPKVFSDFLKSSQCQRYINY